MMSVAELHVHDWLVVREEHDAWGVVRQFECPSCGNIRYL
jgi:hypothetical protein